MHRNTQDIQLFRTKPTKVGLYKRGTLRAIYTIAVAQRYNKKSNLIHVQYLSDSLLLRNKLIPNPNGGFSKHKNSSV